jgi:hypothetical protein
MTRRTTTVPGTVVAILLFVTQTTFVGADTMRAMGAQQACEATTSGAGIPVPGQNPALDAAREHCVEMVAATWAADRLATAVGDGDTIAP